MAVTTVVAVCGAAVSTLLGLLAWRKDRRRVRFYVSYHQAHDWCGMKVSVVNAGIRPVTLLDACFELADGGGYLNDLDENLGLPVRLGEGEGIVLSFPADDVDPETVALVVRDIERREHRMVITPDGRARLERFHSQGLSMAHP